MKRLARIGGVLLGFSVGAAFLYLTLRSLDWATVKTAFASARPEWLLAALAACGLAFTLRMERWRWMLASIGSRASLATLAPPFLGSFALNNILPLRAGDVVRAAAFRNRIGVSPSGSTATLLVERVFDLYALLLLGAIALAASPSVFSGLSEGVQIGAFTGLSVVVAGLTLVLTFPRSFARLALVIMGHPLGRIFPRRLVMFGVRTLVRISHIVRRVGPARMIGMSLAAWAAEGAVFFWAAQALGFGSEPGGPWLALVAGNLGALLPGPPGHFGTFHYLSANAFAAAGPTFEQSVLAVAVGHFLIWAAVTSAGLAALAVSRESGAILAGAAGTTQKQSKSAT